MNQTHARCPPGFFCQGDADPQPCPPGTWSDQLGISNASSCYPCPGTPLSRSICAKVREPPQISRSFANLRENWNERRSALLVCSFDLQRFDLFPFFFQLVTIARGQGKRTSPTNARLDITVCKDRMEPPTTVVRPARSARKAAPFTCSAKLGRTPTKQVGLWKKN